MSSSLSSPSEPRHNSDSMPYGDFEGVASTTRPCFGQRDEVNPAICRVEAPAHEALVFQAVQESHDAACRYLETFPEGLLREVPGGLDATHQGEVAGLERQAPQARNETGA